MAKCKQCGKLYFCKEDYSNCVTSFDDPNFRECTICRCPDCHTPEELMKLKCFRMFEDYEHQIRRIKYLPVDEQIKELEQSIEINDRLVKLLKERRKTMEKDDVGNNGKKDNEKIKEIK